MSEIKDNIKLHLKKMYIHFLQVCFIIWYQVLFRRFWEAWLQQGIYNYRASWRFKEKYQTLGLKEAENFVKHSDYIQYCMKRLSFYVKARIFIDSMILRKDKLKIPFYIDQQAEDFQAGRIS